MAVIKIVPMPGAKGDKGDEGATGAQGLQGPIGATGPAGADALWSYNGAWQSNAAYAVGDLVTYQGQLYYTKSITTAGTLPTDTTKFDLIAAKGETGSQGLQGPEAPSLISSGTWDAKFAFHSGIDATGNLGYEGHKLGSYYCIGDLVHWEFTMLMRSPVSWGTALSVTPEDYTSWAFELPFPPYYKNENPVVATTQLRNAFMRKVTNGWLNLRANADPTNFVNSNNQVIPPVYGESEYHLLIANAITRTYIRAADGHPLGITNSQITPESYEGQDLMGMAFIVIPNEAPEAGPTGLDETFVGNPETIGYRHVNSVWPANLVQALADQNDGVPANNALPINPQGFNDNTVQFNFSGVYRKA